ncbi:Monocyte to macrophage differentiation factor 2 [Portunus trituberculatus]|uniref:Monocyte to macrophage differentiation factor 2 n=1 Tax=Portunus trituberculatus TaxID=210409 RepID=A0A5B7HIP6_PORTR|nr:Monocyte to macrophage differentiation factor 2 [Portunus trituberculatus]
MAWMNGVAVGQAAYQPTSVEHWANMVTHGLFVLPAIYGAVFMVTAAHCSLHQLAAAIYGLGLAGLFSVSTFFHIVFYLGYYKSSVRCLSEILGTEDIQRTRVILEITGIFHRKLKEVLHRGDRAMIYVFIATSYTPWLLLRPLPQDSWTLHLRWGIWVLAVVGILYQQMFHERFKMLETVFYLVIGIMPSMAVMNMVSLIMPCGGVEKYKTKAVAQKSLLLLFCHTPGQVQEIV